MRYHEIINKNLSILDESSFDDWGMGGGWITDRGELVEVDHKNGIHHSNLALSEFKEFIDTDDDGEYDDYSKVSAVSMAYDNGWVRISTRKKDSCSVEWRSNISVVSVRALISYIKNNPIIYKKYEIESPNAKDHMELFDNVIYFEKRLLRLLQSSRNNINESSTDIGLGGGWITNTGEFLEIDHKNNKHHSHIALDHFSHSVSRNEKGHYDGYSFDQAWNIAMRNGWIRISTRDNEVLAVEWTKNARDLSKEAKLGLLTYLKNNVIPYSTYELETPELKYHMDYFYEKKNFIRRLREMFSKRTPN